MAETAKVFDLELNRGVALFKEHNYHEALGVFENLASIDENNESCLYYLAHCYLYEKRFEDSLELFEDLSRRHPENADFTFKAGLAAEGMGQLDLAIENYQITVEHNSSHALAYGQLAAILTNEGRFENAYLNLKKALELKPNHPYFKRIQKKLVAEFNSVYSMLGGGVAPAILTEDIAAAGEAEQRDLSELDPEEKKEKKKLFFWLWFSGDLYKKIGIPLLLLLFLFSAVMMEVISNLRMQELQYTLQNLDQSQMGGKSHELIARYRLISKRFRKKSESSKDYLNEAQLMAVLSGEQVVDVAANQNGILSFMEKPAIIVVNGVNSLVGADPIKNIKEDRGQKLLEIAYFYERKRQYTNAVKVYNAALVDYAENKSKTSFVKLHRGFSLSLLGKRKDALEDYHSVMDAAPNGEMGLTAEVLASFLMGIGNKLKKIEKKKDSIEKGVQYYKLMEYGKSIDLLTKLRPKYPRNQKLNFYRGRAYEESGNVGQAIADYRKVIRTNPNTELAKKANRRLFLLGSFYGADKAIRDEAKKNAIIMNDKSFIKKSKNVERAMDNDKLKAMPQSKAIIKAVEFVNQQNRVINVAESQNKGIPGMVSVGDSGKIDLDKEKEDQIKLAMKLRKQYAANLKRKERLKKRKLLLKARERRELEKEEIDEEEKARLRELKLQKAEKKRRAEEEKNRINSEKDRLEKIAAKQRKEAIALKKKQKAERLKREAALKSKERIERIEDPSLTEEKRKRMLKRKGAKIYRIFTYDGLIFVGTIQKETRKYIELTTIVGPFRIPKVKIAMKTRSNQRRAIK